MRQATTRGLVPASGDRLVLDHMGLARSLSRRFLGRGESQEDLEQVAIAALVAAARRFDDSRGVAFSTFAVPSILGELKRHFRDRGWWVRVPRRVQETYLLVGEARETLTQQLGRSPTVAEISDHTGVTDEELAEAARAAGSYRPSTPTGHRGGDAPPVIEDLPSDAADGFQLVDDVQCLRDLLPRFSQLERWVVAGYYFDDRTQAELGHELGVSQMTVSRTLSGVIRRLRAEMVERGEPAVRKKVPFDDGAPPR